jgi:hypothetical protein
MILVRYSDRPPGSLTELSEDVRLGPAAATLYLDFNHHDPTLS